MSEAEYLAWIRSALRSRWLRWRPRSLALERARQPYSGPNKAQKWVFQCAMCLKRFKAKEVEVDHFPHDAGSIRSIEDVGPFANRLYCEVDNLRVVCKPCHKIHTYAVQQGVDFETAALLKKVVAFDKLPVSQQHEMLANLNLPTGKTKQANKVIFQQHLEGCKDE